MTELTFLKLNAGQYKLIVKWAS